MLETLYWEKYPLAFFGNVFGTGFHKCHCGLTHNGFEKNKGLSCGYKKQTVFKIQLIEKLKKYCLLRLFYSTSGPDLTSSCGGDIFTRLS